MKSTIGSCCIIVRRINMVAQVKLVQVQLYELAHYVCSLLNERPVALSRLSIDRSIHCFSAQKLTNYKYIK